MTCDEVYSIAIDASGNKWIGTYNGLAVYNEEGIIAIKDNKNVLKKMHCTLYQKYPFKQVSFSILKQSFVTLKVFDIKGRILKTLLNNFKRAGNHQVDFDCRDMPNGTCFVYLRVGYKAIIKKMVVLK